MSGTTLEKLNVILDANMKPYKQALKSAETETTKSTTRIKNTLGSINSFLKKIGAAVASAFAVKQLISFGKSCIDLASDLDEVQNVVDVTFGAMSEEINKFAKEALEKFGLSETAAKQYASTMGAMLKSMGLTTQQAKEMSMNITGLAADMASFYNLDNDVAFEKIRAGISGETEPLKQLGINMSVANLEAYALSQGITTSYQKMDQSSQALLRYNYLLSVTADAQGDFARTSDGWANQTRVLQERWNQLKTTIGTGLLQALTPVLQMVNKLLSALLAAADAFQNFINKVTGKNKEVKSSFSDAGGSVSGLGDAASAAGDDATGAADKSADAAKKAKKAADRTIASFDELHVMNKKDDSDDSSGGAGLAGLGTGGYVTSMTEAATATDDTLNPALDKLLKKLQELKEYFMRGWNLSFGTVNTEPLISSANKVKEHINDIFTDPNVVGAANRWAQRTAQALGQVAGAAASIAVTIATNLVGGFEKYLSQNKNRIKQYIIDMFDITGDINEIIGNFSTAFAEIFSVFGGENGQRVTAAIIGIFSDAFMGVTKLVSKAIRDIIDLITYPFIENKDKIKEALDGTLGVIADVLETIKELVDDTSDKMNEVYDEHIHPLLMSLKEGISDSFGKLLDVYNEKVKPALDRMAAKFKEFKDEHLQPMIDAFLDMVGQIASTIQTLWEKWLKPLLDWVIQNILPIVIPIVERIWNTIVDAWGHISEALHALWDLIKNVFKLVQDIVNGDWSAAWEDVKNIVSNAWTFIKEFVLGILTGLWAAIQEKLALIEFGIKAAWEFIKDGVSGLKEWLFDKVQGIIEDINLKIMVFKDWLHDSLDNIHDKFVEIVDKIFHNESVENTVGKIKDLWEGLKENLSNLWENIKSLGENAWNLIKEVILGPVLLLCDLVTGNWDKLKEDTNKHFDKISEYLKNIWESIKGIFKNAWEAIQKSCQIATTAIKNLIEEAWKKVKEKTSEIWNKVKDTIKDMLTKAEKAVKEFPAKFKKAAEDLGQKFINGLRSFAELPSKFKSWGQDMIYGLWDGIVDVYNRVIDQITDLADGIRSLLHFSRPDEGPLRDYEGWMPDFMEGLAKGIRDNKDLVLNEMEKLAEDMDRYTEDHIPDAMSFETSNISSVHHTSDGYNEAIAYGVSDAVSEVLMGFLQNLGRDDDKGQPIVINLDSVQLYRGVLKGKRKYDGRVQAQIN